MKKGGGGEEDGGGRIELSPSLPPPPFLPQFPFLPPPHFSIEESKRASGYFSPSCLHESGSLLACTMANRAHGQQPIYMLQSLRRKRETHACTTCTDVSVCVCVRVCVCVCVTKSDDPPSFIPHASKTQSRNIGWNNIK